MKRRRRGLVLGRDLDDYGFDAEERAAISREMRELQQSDYGPYFPLSFGAPAAPDAVRRRRLGGRLITLVPFVPAAAMVLAVASSRFIPEAVTGWRWGGLVVALVAVQLALSIACIAVLLQRAKRPYLAAVLRRRGIVRCERCGYTISTGNPDETANEPRCPECGWAVP